MDRDVFCKDCEHIQESNIHGNTLRRPTEFALCLKGKRHPVTGEPSEPCAAKNFNLHCMDYEEKKK